MNSSKTEKKLILFQPRYLWSFVLIYAMIIVVANWFDARFIRIFDLDTDAGTLIFPFTFLLSGLITEIYGFKNARLAIWCGFLCNAFFIAYGQFISWMPSPGYPTNNEMFDSLLTINIRIMFASAISYLFAEPLNSLIMAKLKILMKGQYVGIRVVLATMVATGTDSFAFGMMAFFGEMNYKTVSSLILTMWFIKMVVVILGMPIAIHLMKKLKHLEKLDVYDNKTNFNLFSVDVKYSADDNEFKD